MEMNERRLPPVPWPTVTLNQRFKWAERWSWKAFRDEADMHKGAIRFGPGFAFRLKGTLGSPRTPQEASWF